MPRTAQCGTDSGYYRHRRKLNEEPCDACKAAHAARWRENKQDPLPQCPCGTRLRIRDATYCSRCRRNDERRARRAEKQHTVEDEHEHEKPAPDRWERRGLIWHPVYEQRDEVA
jgi:hypothetical protein